LTLIKLDPMPASQAKMIVFTWSEGIECAIGIISSRVSGAAASPGD
jgi:hypothetical protein